MGDQVRSHAPIYLGEAEVDAVADMVLQQIDTAGKTDLEKIRRARELIRNADASVWLQVDGGVSAETIERCAEAGADVFVAGSAVYGEKDPAAAVEHLRALAERATAR